MIADRRHRIVCYATLSVTSVDRSASPAALAKGAPIRVPALLVGRLATDTRVTGLGLGTEMVKHILATAAELNVKAACRAVVVTALDATAFRWWQRFGFAPFDAEDPTNVDLYLLTRDIDATLAVLTQPTAGSQRGLRPSRASSCDCTSASSSTAMGALNIPDAANASGSVGRSR